MTFFETRCICWKLFDFVIVFFRSLTVLAIFCSLGLCRVHVMSLYVCCDLAVVYNILSTTTTTTATTTTTSIDAAGLSVAPLMAIIISLVIVAIGGLISLTVWVHLLMWCMLLHLHYVSISQWTRKPSCRWQTRATRCNVIVAPSGGTPSNINEIYTSMKSTFSGLQFRRSIRLAVRNRTKFQENLTL